MSGSSPEAVANLHVGRVRHIQQGRLLSAAVLITDPNDGVWLPPSDLTFRALDRRGKVIATYQTTVSMGPAGSKVVVAPLLYLGPNARDFRSVDVVLTRAAWRPASTFVPAHVRVTEEHVARDGGFTVVKGHIANRGQSSVAVQISCSLWADHHLAGVGIATVPRLGDRDRRPVLGFGTVRGGNARHRGLHRRAPRLAPRLNLAPPSRI